jgi:hypothetical protein
MLDGVEAPLDVDGKDLVPRSRVGLRHIAVALDAGCGHQDVEASEPAGHIGHGLRHCRFVPHVGPCRHGRRPLGEVAGEGVDFPAHIAAGQDGRALTHQHLGRGQADPARPAGDQCDLAGQLTSG